MINFDLDTDELRRIFGEPNRSTAYNTLKQYFIKNEFEHRQGSCYISKNPLSAAEVYALLFHLLQKASWLRTSVNKLDVTNVGKDHDYLYIFKNDYNEDVEM
ncbi:MAG: hypothetical protein LBS85_06675 [Clostridiales Family XIII bacterium]|jgi:virulence-associated protein VapD|nr:hypothetical protein [Clostridiales Family XIII bacterium]